VAVEVAPALVIGEDEQDVGPIRRLREHARRDNKEGEKQQARAHDDGHW